MPKRNGFKPFINEDGQIEVGDLKVKEIIHKFGEETIELICDL